MTLDMVGIAGKGTEAGFAKSHLKFFNSMLAGIHTTGSVADGRLLSFFFGLLFLFGSVEGLKLRTESILGVALIVPVVEKVPH